MCDILVYCYVSAWNCTPVEYRHARAFTVQDSAHIQVRILCNNFIFHLFSLLGNIVMHLTSPMGTKSMILSQRPKDDDSREGFSKWPFMTTHTWGETSQGKTIPNYRDEAVEILLVLYIIYKWISKSRGSNERWRLLLIL